MRLPEKVAEKLKNIPDKPGCYIMRNRAGDIIYVGKAISLRKRVQSYFRAATFRHAPYKLRGLIKSVHDLDYIVLRNEAEAILTEGKMIKDYKPRYNVSFKDDKRFPLLGTDPTIAFPKFKLCRIKKKDNFIYFGPYTSSTAARTTLDFIEKKFGLRKCAPSHPDENTYKHCLNDIIRFCSAPCIEKITPEEYRKQFDEACAFLTGDRPKYLKELQEQMETASSKLDFERAAAIRDTMIMLRRTIEQKVRIAPTPEMKREDARTGTKELQKVLKIDHPIKTMEGYDISNISGTYSVASMVCFENGMPHRNKYRRFRIKTITHSDDPGMMAEVIRRRFSRLKKENGRFPDLVLVDGGITQLRAARAELKKLGLKDIPVAGLAKRLEEIYWNEESKPIRLPKNSKALKVLQRVRDEAHRFALTYHRHLRGKRIKESALDEIPGIGNKRKQLLLQHFGSVARLAKASETDITDIPGIGKEMAALILSGLKHN